MPDLIEIDPQQTEEIRTANAEVNEAITAGFLEGWEKLPDGRYLKEWNGHQLFFYPRTKAEGRGFAIAVQHKGKAAGPDYMPDDKYLYPRSAKMALWRHLKAY